MSPVKALRSSWAATMALVLVMWAQVPHSKYVFERIIAGGQDGWPFALGFEVAVLMFVARSIHWASWLFAGLSALINVKYYEMHSVSMWGGKWSDIWGEWLLSLALPFVIAMYSHILAYVQGEDVHLHMPDWVRGWVASGRMRLQGLLAHVKVQPTEDAPIEDASPVAPLPDVGTDATVDKRARAVQLFAEGLTVAQVASEVDAPVGTVKSWRARMNGHKVGA